MKKHLALRLSFWAKTHRPAAIAVIAASKIAIGIIGFNLGILAALEGIVLPLETKWLLALVAAASILAYPAKHLKKRLGRAAFYRRQKTTDGILAVLGFAILFFVGNLSPAWVTAPNTAAAASANASVALSCLEKPIQEARKEIVRGGKLKRWVATKVQARAERVIARLKRATEGSDEGTQILLSILCVGLAVILSGLVFALSCNLSCSGQESAAAIVAIFGMTGIIVLTILAMRAIWRGKDGGQDSRHQKKKRPPTGTGKGN